MTLLVVPAVQRATGRDDSAAEMAKYLTAASRST
jgi:hypothetical protein